MKLIKKIGDFFWQPSHRVFTVMLIVGFLASVLSFLFMPQGPEGGLVSSNTNPLFEIVFSGVSDIMVQFEVAFSKAEGVGWDVGIIYAVLVAIAVVATKATTKQLTTRYCPHSKVAEFFFELSVENIMFIVFTLICLSFLSPLRALFHNTNEIAMIFVIIVGVILALACLPGMLYAITVWSLLFLSFGILQNLEGNVGKIITVVVAIAIAILAEVFAMDAAKALTKYIIDKLDFLPYNLQRKLEGYIDKYL